MTSRKSEVLTSLAAIVGGLLIGVPAHGSLQTDLEVYVDFEGGFANKVAGGPATSLFTGSARYSSGKVGSSAGDFRNTNGGGSVPNDWSVAIGTAGDSFNGANASDGIYGTNNTAGFSFNLWMKTSNFNDRAVFGNKNWTSGSNQGWNLVTTGNKTINWTSPGGIRWDINYQPQGSNDGTWHMISAVFDRSTDTVHTYFDGVNLLNGTIRPAGGTLWSSSSFATLIGASGPGNYSGTAELDDVAIWSRALSASEVTELYNSGSGLSLLSTSSSALPEPSTYVLASLGIIGLALLGWRRRLD